MQQPTHKFNQEQQTIILNAVQAMLDEFGSALMLNVQLGEVHHNYIDMMLVQNKAGELIYRGTAKEHNSAYFAYKGVADLCREIDMAAMMETE